MRKIILCFLILLVISLVGCNKTDNTSSALQVNKSSELSQSTRELNNSSEEVIISSEISTIAESSQDSVSSNVSSEPNKCKTNSPKETNNSSNKVLSSDSANKQNTNNGYLYFYEDENGKTYHQNGKHWDDKGNVWTDEDIAEYLYDE